MAGNISSQTHVARGATFIFIQGFLNSGLGVLYVWFLLHTREIAGQILFTESDYGLFTMLSFIFSISSTLGVLALRPASVRFLAHYLAEGKTEKAKSMITRVLQVSLITSVTIMVVLLVSARELSSILGSPMLTLILLPMCSALSIFYAQAQGFLQGLQRLKELALISVSYTMIHYSIAVLLVYAGYGVLGIVISWLFALALVCSVGLVYTIRTVGFSTETHDLRSLLSFSLPIYAFTFLTIVVGWVDQIFVFPFLGLEALGVYNLAVRASIVPRLVSVALKTSLFPKLAELHSRFGAGSLKAAFEASTRYAALMGFPLSLMVAVLAYPIVVLFATVKFINAVGPLTVMCIASLPTILGSAISPTFYTLRRTKLASSITAVSIVLEALLAYVLLAYFSADLVGVAITRLLAASAAFALGAYYLRRHLEIKFDREALWKSAAASLAMVWAMLMVEVLRAVISPLSYQFLALRLRQLPIYVAVGGVTYILTLALLGAVKQQDIELFEDYLPTRLHWVVDLLRRITHPR